MHCGTTCRWMDVGNVLLGNLESYIHLDFVTETLLQTRYKPLGQWCSLVERGLFPLDNAPYHTEHVVQKGFEEHDEDFKVLPWSPSSISQSI